MIDYRELNARAETFKMAKEEVERMHQIFGISGDTLIPGQILGICHSTGRTHYGLSHTLYK